MAEYAPAAIQALFNRVKAGIPEAILAGIVGDEAHTYGYHRGRNYVSSSDYSNQLAADKQGDGEAASALDISWTAPAPQYTVSARLMAAKTDPRMYPIREFFGSVDGVTVCGWDFYGNYPVTSDSSHLWHIHLSVLRSHANDTAALAAVADVIIGAGPAGPQPAEDDDMYLIQAPDRPVKLMTGGTLIGLADSSSVQAFTAAGVKTVKLTARDYDSVNKWASVRNTG
jgi:hypothetical protein